MVKAIQEQLVALMVMDPEQVYTVVMLAEVEAMVEEAVQESGVDVAATVPTSGADDERKQRLAALAAARKGSPG